MSSFSYSQKSLMKSPFLLFSCLFGLAQISSAADKKPNIIVILADDLGRGDYSAFGSQDIHTPQRTP